MWTDNIRDMEVKVVVSTYYHALPILISVS